MIFVAGLSDMRGHGVTDVVEYTINPFESNFAIFDGLEVLWARDMVDWPF